VFRQTHLCASANKWDIIEKYLPGRADDSIKNHSNLTRRRAANMKKKKSKKFWSVTRPQQRRISQSWDITQAHLHQAENIEAAARLCLFEAIIARADEVWTIAKAWTAPQKLSQFYSNRHLKEPVAGQFRLNRFKSLQVHLQ
jgi:hypothetical protein